MAIPSATHSLASPVVILRVCETVCSGSSSYYVVSKNGMGRLQYHMGDLCVLIYQELHCSLRKIPGLLPFFVQSQSDQIGIYKKVYFKCSRSKPSVNSSSQMQHVHSLIRRELAVTSQHDQSELAFSRPYCVHYTCCSSEISSSRGSQKLQDSFTSLLCALSICSFPFPGVDSEEARVNFSLSHVL